MKEWKNYIIKHFNNKKEKRDFYFLRWLSEINKNEKDTNYVCNKIAKFIHNKNTNLPFLDIFVVDDNVFIYTPRPGKWLGEKACMIDELQHMLNYNTDGVQVHDFQLRIIEPENTNYNTVMNFLRGYKAMSDKLQS